jgi:diaminopimelate epimerase
MGAPRLARREIPMAGEPADEAVIEQPLDVAGRTFNITCVSMGNPHCVIFVDDVNECDVTGIGPEIENHELFPKRTNVEFVTVVDRGHLRVRVWERGSGETLACGTGACAAVVAAVLTDRAERQARVELRGGELRVEWHEDAQVFMTGPATEVFSGTVPEQLVAAARR